MRERFSLAEQSSSALEAEIGNLKTRLSHAETATTAHENEIALLRTIITMEPNQPVVTVENLRAIEADIEKLRASIVKQPIYGISSSPRRRLYRVPPTVTMPEQFAGPPVVTTSKQRPVPAPRPPPAACTVEQGDDHNINNNNNNNNNKKNCNYNGRATATVPAVTTT